MGEQCLYHYQTGVSLSGTLANPQWLLLYTLSYNKCLLRTNPGNSCKPGRALEPMLPCPYLPYHSAPRRARRTGPRLLGYQSLPATFCLLPLAEEKKLEEWEFLSSSESIHFSTNSLSLSHISSTMSYLLS